MQKDYEVIFIFDAKEQVFSASLDKVKALFKDKNVKIAHEEDMAVRTLCYEIKKHTEGHYYLFKINLDTQLVLELSKELKLYDDLLKFMFVKIEIKYIKAPKKKAS